MSVNITSAKLTGTTVRAEADSSAGAPTWKLKIFNPGPPPVVTERNPTEQGGGNGKFYANWNNVTAPAANCTVVAKISQSKGDEEPVTVAP